MANLLKQEYELSIWEDYVSNDDDSSFHERKLAIIGSNDLVSPIKAYDVSLKENINGERTLTFSIPRKYRDNGELLDNPFIGLLQAERKLKLRDGPAYEISDDLHELTEEDSKEEWLDFVIKSIDEDKDSFVNSYTCKELFVNELGKNGWSVVLDTELENNYGTLPELAEKVLEGSGWKVSGYNPTERVDEQLFVLKAPSSFKANSTMKKESATLSNYIYFFYTGVEWKTVGSTTGWYIKTGENQCLWKNGQALTENDADDNRVIIDDDIELNYDITINGNYQVFPSGSVQDPSGNTIPLQGGRVVKSIDSHFEPVADKYVYDYEVTNASAGASVGTIAYSYTETQYATTDIVKNYLANSSNFVTQVGWLPVDGATLHTMPLNYETLSIDPTNYLVLNSGTAYYNEGPANQKMRLIKDNVYVVRMKARLIDVTKDNYDTSSIPVTAQPSCTVDIGTYDGGSWVTKSTGSRSLNTSSINTSTDYSLRGYPAKQGTTPEDRTESTGKETTVFRDEQGYTYCFLVAKETTLATSSQIHLKVQATSTGNYKWHIADIQLFDFKTQSIGGKNVPIFPGDIPESTMIETQYFYNIEKSASGDKVNYLSSNTAYYKPKYRDNYESVRNISVKESTYFNNINSLAELFEVWVRFKVHHTKDGKIMLDENGDPIKEVIFSQFAPTDVVNWSGFKYGINLNSIKRSIDSTNIASKIIVKDNNNEFATDGMASIRRAHDNPSGENVIYDFDYYVNMGMLDYSQMLADLYGYMSTDMAYLRKMRDLNNEYNPLSEKLIAYSGAVDDAEEWLEYCKTGIDSASEELAWQKQLLESYANMGDTTSKKHKEITVAQLEAQIAQFKLSQTTYQNQVNHYNELIYGEDGESGIQAQLDDLMDQKKALTLKFYKKYYRYIQEGTWTDDQYIDDDLYYLDACKVASQSSFPKTSYNIGVIDIGNIEKYAAYTFRIGEKTYIEDTEFFGYVWKKGSWGTEKTPFKMEAVVSERSRNLDDPSKSSLTIQTYKNQFEELFSKITATTTSLQYASGGYDRAANTITPDGEIETSTLEQSFANNSWILANSKNQSVVWDSGTGIEVTDLSNSSTGVRVTSMGIFLTTDGGRTWINGITGNGINTRFLLAGQIDAGKINITSGNGYVFRWDADGLNAYYNQQGTVNQAQYVRFNQYGLFGTMVGSTLDQLLQDAVAANKSYDEQLQIVKENSTFSLTWEGLYLQSQDGAVGLDPIGGLQVFNPEWAFGEEIIGSYAYIVKPSAQTEFPQLYAVGDLIPLVSLGKFYDTVADNTPYYGLRMRNQKGEITLRTDNFGNLWLANELTVGNKDVYETEVENSDRIYLVKDEEDGMLRFTIPTSKITGVTSPTITCTETGVSYTYSEDDYTLEEDSAIFSITPNTVFDTEDTIIETGFYTLIYNTKERWYRYLGINGAVDDYYLNQEDSSTRGGNNPIVLYVGNTTATAAPFIIYGNGEFVATEANITGVVNAQSGFFSGTIQVGNTNGINGDLNAPYAFWAGQSIGSIPSFYVTPSGDLYGNSVTIEGDSVFTGVIHANDGDFKGTITADTGRINILYFNDTESYIGAGKGTEGTGLTNNEDLFININNSAFGVNKIGEIYGDSLMLGRNDSWYQSYDGTVSNLWNYYNILIGQDKDQGYVISIFDPSTVELQSNRVFGVGNDGTVHITGTLNTDGDLNFGGALVSYSKNMRIDGINESITVKTPAVDGWGIYGDGSAYFSNVYVRGLIQSAVFEYNRISSIGGQMVVTPSFQLTSEVSPNSDNLLSYDLSSFITTSDLWTNITGVMVDVNGTFVGTEDDPVQFENGILTLTADQANTLGINGKALPFGTQIISRDTSINTTLISAQDPKGSYISVRGPLSEGTRTTTLIGNLVNRELPTSAASTFGLTEFGYGLYADNAYLIGRLYLPSAGITNESTRIAKLWFNRDTSEAHDDETGGGNIRIWAGASQSNKANAPFIVTQDGTLYAQDGYFNGTVNAINSHFQGFIRATGILIGEENLAESQYNHFFFIWDDGNGEETSVNPDNYIVDINENGINIWEGGLNVFSDYYSGWRIDDSTLEENKTQTPHALYGWTPLIEDGEIVENQLYYPETTSPWPIMTVLDKSSSNSYTPRISMSNLQVWFAELGEVAHGVKISGNSIGFQDGESTVASGSNYDSTANDLWNSSEFLSIGKHGDLQGIRATVFDVYDTAGNSALTVTPAPVSTTTDSEYTGNESEVKFNGYASFGEVMQIQQVKDGIIFTYIGD